MKPISLYEFGSNEEVVRRIQQPFVDMFRDQGPVLDVGCGRGVFLKLLTEAGIEVVGIDQSREAVTACQEKGFKVNCEDGRAYLSRNPGQFGGIFCSHVIEHMGYEDAFNFLNLCHAALRKDGVLLLVTPNPEDLTIISGIFWLDPTHIRPYPLLLLKTMLDAVGFQVTRESQFLGSWRMVGKRHLPGYLFRRMLLGRHFGRPNTMVLARKNNRSD
jgi:2-polyprenyl-3-methyl-5-hydroxy-6-metoxy-1,4-benzoquinol methylase